MSQIPEESKVSYRFLGRSGLKVSNICLGTATFGRTERSRQNQPDEAISHSILDRYLEWGGNYLDTADMYTDGLSETIIGNWMKKHSRENLVVASKVRFRNGSGPNDVGLSRRHITSSIEKSLERLQTNYLDLYQMHAYDAGTPIEETIRTMDDLVRCGKVRYVGGSNFIGWHLQNIVGLSRSLGLNPFVSLQQEYNLVSRYSELEVFQVCKMNGLGVLPYSPLGGGFLTGKYERSSVPTEGRLGYIRVKAAKEGKQSTWDKLQADDQKWEVIGTLQTIAKNRGKTPAQVALRWLLQKDVVVSPIIGATSVDQLNSNMEANGWALTPDEMALLDDVSKPEVRYPYSMIWNKKPELLNPFHCASYDVANTF